MDAWAVIKEDVNQKQAIIVDYFGPPSDGVNGSFLTHLIGHYRQRGIESIVTWLPQHHFIAQALLSVGFFKKMNRWGSFQRFDHLTIRPLQTGCRPTSIIPWPMPTCIDALQTPF